MLLVLIAFGFFLINLGLSFTSLLTGAGVSLGLALCVVAWGIHLVYYDKYTPAVRLFLVVILVMLLVDAAFSLVLHYSPTAMAILAENPLAVLAAASFCIGLFADMVATEWTDTAVHLVLLSKRRARTLRAVYVTTAIGGFLILQSGHPWASLLVSGAIILMAYIGAYVP